MMGLRRPVKVHRGDESGATLVEFALVAPIVFMLLFGLIAGCFLAYQNSALHDGATAGARMASIESSLVTQDTTAGSPNYGLYCESGSPTPIETAIAQAAPLLSVNPNSLCSTDPNAGSLNQTTVNDDVNIVVTCVGSGGCANPAAVTVSLTYTTKGLVAPIGLTYHMGASSQVPVLSP
jgi:Flp pilus assembly protein TadG